MQYYHIKYNPNIGWFASQQSYTKLLKQLQFKRATIILDNGMAEDYSTPAEFYSALRHSAIENCQVFGDGAVDIIVPRKKDFDVYKCWHLDGFNDCVSTGCLVYKSEGLYFALYGKRKVLGVADVIRNSDYCAVHNEQLIIRLYDGEMILTPKYIDKWRLSKGDVEEYRRLCNAEPYTGL